jgi:hypothetical protein
LIWLCTALAAFSAVWPCSHRRERSTSGQLWRRACALNPGLFCGHPSTAAGAAALSAYLLLVFNSSARLRRLSGSRCLSLHGGRRLLLLLHCSAPKNVCGGSGRCALLSETSWQRARLRPQAAARALPAALDWRPPTQPNQPDRLVPAGRARRAAGERREARVKETGGPAASVWLAAPPPAPRCGRSPSPR